MTEYDAQYIEETLKRVARTRIGEKISGDGGYWYGGRCEWGGAHNLQEDCQTLTKFFTKTSELKNTRRKLTSFDNEQEFNSLKQNLISRCNESINGLQAKTGSNTSVGGVCIIWDDFVSNLRSILDAAREEIETLKRDIERTAFTNAKKLKKLQIEEASLKKSIEENLQRAQNEKDPEKKRKLLILVDDDKKKLKSNLEKQEEFAVGRNLNIDKHIKDFLEKIEQKLDPNRNPRTPNINSTSPGGSGSRKGGSTGNPLDPFQSSQNTLPNQFQANKNLIIIFAIALLIFLYFYSKSSKSKEENYYYDF